MLVSLDLTLFTVNVVQIHSLCPHQDHLPDLILLCGEWCLVSVQLQLGTLN